MLVFLCCAQSPGNVSSQKTGGLFTIREEEVEEMEGEGFNTVFDDSGMETILEGEEEEDGEEDAQGQQKQGKVSGNGWRRFRCNKLSVTKIINTK